MSTRRRVAAVDDAAEADAVTVAIDPRYTARHAATPPADQPSEKPAPDSSDDRLERAVRRFGDYWGRACANAWFTVFPRGSAAEIRRRWSRRRPTE